MAAAFTTSDILTATGGTLVHQGAWDTFCGVSTDSRTTQAGGLFIPLTGEKHDGHEFIPAALRRGARGVLVEQRILKAAGVGAGFKPAPTVPGRNFPPEITVIAIPAALTALGDLARAWRARFGVPVVGITGSCGKTTTKEMIAATLAPAFRVLKNRLNLNNLIGMPLTLLELEGTHEAAVVEMGMNAFGEINRLTRISCPTIGVLTNVHPAHTEGVGDIAGVARAKGELIRALDHGATLIYNADDPWVARLAQDFRGPKLSFGLNAAANLRATDRQTRGREGQTARLSHAGQSWPLTLPVPGLHMLYNALAATAVGLSLGMAPGDTAASLEQFRPIHRRSQVETLASGVNLLNDCYNANPGSMAMALSTLMELRDRGRAVAALGDMLELGNGAAADHRALGRLAARLGLDLLVTYGTLRQEVADGAMEAGLAPDRIFPVESRAEGARILRELLAPGDWLLVKGSRSMHMEGLIDRLESE
ncbi:MAG TPA: UDP-N-acetylmuramoyl-tripeptide--D-alanyl-D-alanine ligase [Desulfobaccales bacterium]|nr:UDP-N-acetylmuramoyl-tripeptide--D-alanyl-D-alanine ligase [Desulfobaccales bacterium]